MPEHRSCLFEIPLIANAILYHPKWRLTDITKLYGAVTMPSNIKFGPRLSKFEMGVGCFNSSCAVIRLRHTLPLSIAVGFAPVQGFMQEIECAHAMNAVRSIEIFDARPVI